jgi:hypothetical protein
MARGIMSAQYVGPSSWVCENGFVAWLDGFFASLARNRFTRP